MRGPVQRAEKRACGDGRVGGPQRTAFDAVGDERADPALVAIALGDDARAKARGQRVDGEVGGRSLHLVDEAQHMRGGQGVQAIGQRLARIPPCFRQRVEQARERSILAIEQDLVLAAEVVIQVAGRQIGGDGDLPHPGGREAARAEHPRRRPHDVDPPRIGAD